MESQRRDRRYPLAIAVRLQDGGRVQETTTEDVSLRGVFLRTEMPLAMRTLLRVRLTLLDGPLETHGIVVHTAMERADRATGVGVQLFGLDRHLRQRWEAFVSAVAGNVAPLDAPWKSTLANTHPPRKHERYAAILRVEVETRDALQEMFTRDVSRGGMFISTRFDLEVGTPVLVQVHHPDDPASVFRLAAVVRHRRDAPDPANAGLGVEFMGLTDVRQTAFMDFVKAGIRDSGSIFIDEDDPIFLETEAPPDSDDNPLTAPDSSA